jgi:D-lactate dehydrogenase
MFGPADSDDDGVQSSFEQLCERAGIVLMVPPAIDGLCCGTPWSSKGMAAGQQAMRERVLAELREATYDGELPVIADAASCTEGLIATLESHPGEGGRRPLRVIDAVQFTAERILPLLGPYPKLDSLALHPTCSSTRLGLNDSLQQVASAVAESVLVPATWGCCAFAGDRGMLHPELTASATSAQAAEVKAFGATAHASCNRTCELGMTRATERSYHHILELLAEQTAKG